MVCDEEEEEEDFQVEVLDVFAVGSTKPRSKRGGVGGRRRRGGRGGAGAQPTENGRPIHQPHDEQGDGGRSVDICGQKRERER